MTGNGDIGVYAHDGGTASQDANITTSGDNKSRGAYAMENSAVYISGDVKAKGASSRGVVAQEYSSADVLGKVSASGDASIAAYAYDNSAVYISGDISVSGDNKSRGVYALKNSAAYISGDVKAEGTTSRGVVAQEYSSADVLGKVSASGDASIAAYAYDNSVVYISGDISVSGDSKSRGVYALQNSAAYISGDVKAEGTTSRGVVAQDYSSVDVFGTVSASGDESTAAYAYDNSAVYISGDVSVSGDNKSRAVYSLQNSTMYISGDVKAEGTTSRGVAAQDNSSANIYGSVSVSGDNSIAARSISNGTIKVTGNVSADGNGAVALNADGGTVMVANGAVNASGAGAAAAEIEQGGTVSLDNVIASADSNVLLTTDSGGGLYAENSSKLYGEIINNNITPGNELSISLSGNSYLLGTVNDLGGRAVTSLALSGSDDTWSVTGDSLINGRFTNNGLLDYSPAALGITVTVGGLDGNGSMGMKTDIVSRTGDKLIVTGTTDGSHIIDITNNGSAAATGNEVLMLVQTADRGGNFSLAHDVEAGAWIYGLRQNTSAYGAGAGWELYSYGASNSGSDAVSTFAGAYMLGYTETQTLIQRLGDLRETPRHSSLWFRVHGGKIESDAGKYIKNFDMDYGGVQLGYDRKIKISWDGEAYAGIMFGYSKGDLDYDSNGGGDVESKMLGLYATFIQPSGFYLDAILKYQWMDNEFDSYDSSGAYVTADDISTGGFGFSVEVGQRVSFNGRPKDGWYVEPHLQLSYQRYDEGYFNASNGLRIGVDSFTSMLGRLGALVGYESEKSNFYAKVFRVKEFDGDVTIRANGVSIPESFDGSWWVYGLGFTSKINDRNSIYMDIERAEGGRFEQPWAVKAGWRMEF